MPAWGAFLAQASVQAPDFLSESSELDPHREAVVAILGLTPACRAMSGLGTIESRMVCNNR